MSVVSSRDPVAYVGKGLGVGGGLEALTLFLGHTEARKAKQNIRRRAFLVSKELVH